jgi:serine/threonine-protein kinase
MSDDPRVQQLLDELLDSHATPEEVCGAYPELLPVVRNRWRQMRRVRADLDALFPPSGEAPPRPPEGTALPQIPGYEVEAVLGRGGMGIVFRARHMRLNRLVALKMSQACAYCDQRELERFQREAEAVAGLHHPNVVQLYDVGDVDGRPYFTMEYVEGGSLAQKLAGTPQPARAAAQLVATLAGAVQAAHVCGIVHRDLKPANVLLTADGTPKISDFGLARRLQGGAGLTQSGVPMGTPSYMAPEQARGQLQVLGPALDVYALGAILYDLLTGRPPFRAATAAETVQQVISQEPAAPSRLNDQVPRDLETICLKCLHKDPSRRFAAADALADDLRRFLDGRPILARPVGMFERVVKGARRRPTLTTLLAVLLLSLATVFGTGIVLWQQAKVRGVEAERRRERARQAIEDGITQAFKAAKAERLPEAQVILAEAKKHLANASSEELSERVARAGAELNLAQELYRIRQIVVGASTEKYDQQLRLVDYKQLAAEYGQAFAKGGFDLHADPEKAKAQIQGMVLADTTLAALDEWALAAFLLNRGAEQRKLLHIARLADPDPLWRNRFRDPDTWGDKKKLRQLANLAIATEKLPPAHQLAITATLLRRVGSSAEATQMLRKAQRRRPDDYWLNLETANAYDLDRNFKESIPFRRIVVSLRPRNAWTVNALGVALLFSGEYDEAIAELRHAIQLEPKHEALYVNLCDALTRNGQRNDCVAEWRRFAEAEPNYAPALRGLADQLLVLKRYEEAIPWYHKALGLEPNNADVHLSLGKALRAARRLEQAVKECRQACRLDPSNASAHYVLGYSLQELRRDEEAIAEFEWLIRELDPKKRRKDANLGNGLDSKYSNARNLITLSLLHLGRFAEARSAARLAQAYHNPTSYFYHVLGHYQHVCQLLLPLRSRLHKMLAAGEMPEDLATRLALADWCYHLGKRPWAAVRLYDAAFKQQPGLAEQLAAKHRLSAAGAAVRAGLGSGDDAAKLNDQEKAALRKRALEWLRADLEAWAKRARDKKPGAPARVLRGWQQLDAFAGVRDPAALAKLPEEERTQWRNLWADVNKVVLSDPELNLDRARACISRKEWLKASEFYSRCLEDGYTSDGEPWFEYAAVQLLAGNWDGYRQTCKTMLEAGQKGKLRPYLAARACTLASGSVPEMALVAKLAAIVASSEVHARWWLTEQGALCCRTKRYQDAVLVLGKSLRATSKPGAQVLNWYWLALANYKLGDQNEARSWLTKAVAWLDSVGEEMPSNANALDLHRHNWLEAHILRREAEALIRPTDRRSDTKKQDRGSPQK